MVIFEHTAHLELGPSVLGVFCKYALQCENNHRNFENKKHTQRQIYPLDCPIICNLHKKVVKARPQLSKSVLRPGSSVPDTLAFKPV